MSTRPTYTDISEANAEIRDMEAHMAIMKRMIAVQSERIENFQALVDTLKQNVSLRESQRDNYIAIMENWLDMLKKNQLGPVMDSIHRIITNNKEII